LTCAKIGKGHRLAVHTQSKAFVSKHGSRLQESTVTGEFQVLPGFSESLLPALVSRHQGCITGTGNIFPKTIRKLYDQSIAGLKGDAAALAEAMVLQDRSELSSPSLASLADR
jgi:dihydrodipicolinate synthase/N-acetylneuraminate lyase